MKKISLLILLIISFVAAAFAQSGHDKISYQSVVRDGSNHLLYDTEITVAVSIANSGNPAVVYSETHTVTSNDNGLISFLIGNGSSPSGNWDAIEWNRADITLVTSVAGVQLATYTLPLSAVPYALYAKNAGASVYADSVDINVVKHYVDQQGFLTEEVQVLSISNDTIFLTGGSWVKLPAGFSGDYNDLTNVPTDLVQDANYVHTDNNYTDAEKTKLEGIEAGAEVNVQSDWSETDQSSDAFIQNKPTKLSQFSNDVPFLTQEVQALSISNDTIFLTGGTFVKLPAGFSGSYKDLVDTPTRVSNFQNDAGYLTSFTEQQILSISNDTIFLTGGSYVKLPAGFSGSYKDLVDTPTKVSNFQNDAGYLTSFTEQQVLSISNDTIFLTGGSFVKLPAQAQSDWDQATATAADFIKNKPTKLSQFSNDVPFLTQEVQALSISNDTIFLTGGTFVKLPAGFSGSYKDLVDTPTKVSNFQNDAGYITKDVNNLTHYVKSDTLCAGVTHCLEAALVDGTSTINHAIDTIARHNISDTATAIRNSIGNGQITIQKNGVTITDGTNTTGVFNVNQKANQTINITVPTQTSELTNNSNLAYTTGNTFTGTHSFTSSGTSITVPSNTDAIKRPVPATTPVTECTNLNAVNVCDLLAVFDSLTKRIDSISQALAATQQELDALKSATPPTVSVTLSEVQYTSMKATATASGNGADITSYKFCISTNTDMSGATCFTSTSNEYTFTGLVPYTNYYVTADATNMVGTTTSDVVTKQTAIHAPTGTFSLGSIAPKGFKVTVSSLDFKEPGVGTVQICYKKKEGSSCPSDFSSYSTCDGTLDIASGITDTLRKFINVDEPDVEYCVIVKLNNGDSTTILDPLTINTGAAISLDINHTPTTLNLCGGSLDITYTATTNPSNVDLNDFENFTWSEGTSVDNTTTVTYSSAGNKTITCTATHKTEGYIITGSSSVNVINTGSGPTFSFCIDDLSLDITNITSSATTLNWGDGSTETSNPSTSSTHDYATDGIYSLIATNSEGCSTTKQAAVGIATLHPCTVTSINANEQGSGTTIEKLQDVDDNLYAVVQIGKQCWMKSNLRTTHYSDGTAIANGTGNSANNTTSHTTAYYYQPTASSNFGADFDFSHYNFKTDGLYYNWKAVMHGAAGSTTVPSRVQGVCPDGWHVPSVREWDTLFAFVQTLPNATYWDLHSVGYVHTLTGSCEWTPSSSNNGSSGNYKFPAWNSSELSIVPAGEASTSFRYNTYVGPTSTQEAIFWTTNAANSFAGSPQALACEFYDGSTTRRIEDTYTTFGHSVRCVRDYGEGSPISDPGATSENVTDVDRTTATLNGTVINPDNISITSKGFEWKLSTASDFTTVTVSGDDFTYNLTGLTPGTSYTYRAFVEFAGGTVYGDNISFTTIILPTVATDEATSVGETTATLNGTLTNPDNLTVTSKGFEWKQSTHADYTQTLVDGDDFTLDLTGLSGGTEYSFKAFMIFENNTVYGEEKTFTTKISPTVATDEATAVEVNTATLNGSITNPDDVPLTSKGFEWKLSTATDYTSVTVTGDGLTYDLTGLSENTMYTYRAFIVYAGGTVYGDEASFTTNVPTPTLTITPDPASGVTVCSGGSTTVTYMAKVEEGMNDISDNYSYTWSIPNNLQYITHGKTCTVIYTTSGTHTVTCKASHSPGDTLTKTREIIVSSVSGTVPTFSICDHCGDSLTVTVKSVTSGSSIQWSTGTTYESVSADSWHNYTQQGSGIYIITVTKGNCSSTKRVALGNATLKPCSVNNINPNESGTGSTIDSLQDYDGNWYGVVQIGSQCWMKSNLRTTHYAGGDVIECGNGASGGGQQD